MTLSIDDHGSCKRLAKRMRREAAQMQKELNDANANTADKVKADIARSAHSMLPKRGGLARRIADMDVRAERRPDGVRIIGASDYDVVSIDKGTVHHLVYGHGPVVSQSVAPGFFTRPVIENEREFEAGMVHALEKMVDRIEKG